MNGAVASLNPAYFALVMATGIVSIACGLLDMRPVAVVLLWANSAFYIVLWALTTIRVVRFRDRVAADLMHHGRAVGYFTVVAATCVLGSQWLVLVGTWRLAAWLWAAGIGLWATITYSVFTALTVKADKPSLADGINGGWLVSVVAAQSVAVLGAQLAAGFGTRAPMALFFCLAMWLGGGMLYIWIISLIFYRYTFFALEPSDLAPPYWINMGAVAISALAGSLLVLAAPAFREGADADVLGDRDLVDPDAADSRRVAAYLPPFSTSLRSAVLGRRLPAWHVHGFDVPVVAGTRRAISADGSTGLRLRRAVGMGAGIPRAHRPGIRASATLDLFRGPSAARVKITR
jgi:tellurite resistance protein TehA-like permease